MTKEQEQAKQSEPVEVAKDEHFMDTGVLHEPPKKTGLQGQKVSNAKRDPE